MSRNLRAEVCVGAAIFRRGQMLLLRRSEALTAFPGTWDIPGGHVEEGEELRTALAREVREETGYTPIIGRPFYAGMLDYPVANGRRIRTVEVEFLCSLATGRTPALDPAEHTEFAWVRRYNARTHPAPPILREIIRAAFREVA
jgi:8-oxo-dGTP diphosphatase